MLDLEKIEQLKALLDNGVITEEEFIQTKKKLLIESGFAVPEENVQEPAEVVETVEPVIAPVEKVQQESAVTTEPVVQNTEVAAESAKKKKNTKLIIAIAGVVVVVAAVVFFFTHTRPLTVTDQTFYFGEAAMPEFFADGLVKEDIESIEYSFDQEGVFTVTNDNKLQPEKDVDGPIKCTVEIKAGYKKYKGEFNAQLSYRNVDFENGDMPLGSHSGRCPLSITNPEIGESCYIYFKNNGSGEDFSILLEGESSIKKNVATGKYTMYVAYGYTTQNWYGTKYLFGLNGNNYYMREEPLNFTDNGRTAKGFTITVTSSEGGGLELKKIDYSDFPGTDK